MSHDEVHGKDGEILLPKPTIWPMVLALGIALVLAGMVTNIAVGILGALLALVSCVAWFLQVLPHEAHEPVAVDFAEVAITTARSLQPHSAASP